MGPIDKLLPRRKYDKHFYGRADDISELQKASERRKRNEDFPIGEGTSVVGGTYFPREEYNAQYPVKVDYDHKNPGVYENYLIEVKERMTNTRGSVNELWLPRAVYETVLSNMSMASDDLPRDYAKSDDKDSLAEVMVRGEGEPLHLVLTAAALLDIRDTYGRTSVVTGTRLNQDNLDDREVHVWVEHVDRKGKMTIVDPVKRFCGTLEQSKKKASWKYPPATEEYPSSRDNSPESAEAMGRTAIVLLEEYRKSKQVDQD